MTTTITHPAGTKIEGEARGCISHALKQGGIDFGIRRERLITLATTERSPTIIPNRVGLFRDDTGEYLATVGENYPVVENRDVFLPLEVLTGNGQFEVDLVGEFLGGRKAFVLLKSLIEDHDVAKDDRVGSYVLFATSHDGHGSLSGCTIPYRFNCSNAIAGAMRSSRCVSIVHNNSMRDRMRDLQNFASEVPGEFVKQCKKFQALSKVSVNLEAAENYLTILEAPKRIVKSVIGTAEARDKNVRTLWTLYNGYNSYLNHESSKDGASRLNSVLFGQGAKRDDRALSYALQLVHYLAA